ncbi:MAG: hypothetical protein ABFD92_10015 [Planctomycetaceae bacterium]|nr:hypothetical protein [Planctomycetaceae bacterium]
MYGKRNILTCMLALGVLSGVTVSAWADAQAEKQAAQNKLLSMRAARVDAMRKLAERINGLVITSETTVKDFVATDDRIRTAMTSWLSGMKEVGEPSYTPDGICQVTLEVTVKEVILHLQRLHKEYYKGNKVAYEDIEKISANTKETTLRETGSGAPRPEFADRGQTVAPGTGGEGIMSKRAWAYWMANCSGRGRLMAERAARLDALRKLGERINGILITSETTVKDFVATDDTIRTQMQTFLRGARQVGLRYHDNELIVDMDMEVTVRDLIVNLQRWRKEYYKGDKIASEDIERISARIEDKDIRETGMGVPPDEYLKGEGVETAAVGQMLSKWPPAVQATGQAAIDTENANAAQAKLMAFRAAELDAKRKLAEELDGLVISSGTTVKDFVAMDDQIRTSMMTFMQGSRRINGSEKLAPDGTASVVVEVELPQLWNMVLFYREKLSLKLK